MFNRITMSCSAKDTRLKPEIESAQEITEKSQRPDREGRKETMKFKFAEITSNS